MTPSPIEGLVGKKRGYTYIRSKFVSLQEAFDAVVAIPEMAKRIEELGIKDLKFIGSPSVSPLVPVNNVVYTFEFDYKKAKKLYAILPCSSFNGCCGVNILHTIDIPSYAGNITLGRRGLGTFFVDLVTRMYEYRADHFSGPGLLIAATSDYQTSGARILEKLGWTRSGPLSVNANTGRTITIWSKVVSPFTVPEKYVIPTVPPVKAIDLAVAAPAPMRRTRTKKEKPTAA